MTKNLNYKIIPATIADYPTIQNIARFYVYDVSRYCGLYYSDWNCPENGLFECDDFKHYFEKPSGKPYLIKVDNELAGFVMIDKLDLMGTDFNMGEFFILAKFQHCGFGHKIVIDIFDQYQGTWSVGSIPGNSRALQFWRKVVGEYTNLNFAEKEKTAEELKSPQHPNAYPMIFLIFDSRNKKTSGSLK